MKELYNPPSVEIIIFSSTDALTTSGYTIGDGEDGLWFSDIW